MNKNVHLLYSMAIFRSVLPTLIDHSVREQLSSTSQQFNTEISELHSALIRAKPACQGLGLNAAQKLIADLQEELKEFERAVESHQLKPLPDDNPEKGTQKLAYSCKLVNQGMFLLTTFNEIYGISFRRGTTDKCCCPRQ